MEHANDYIKEITFAFMRTAANKKQDDVGKYLHIYKDMNS